MEKVSKRSQKTLDTLIFFCTAKCDGACLTCFNWSRLNKVADLSLGEIEKVAKSLPSFRRLMVSGGEPFLRIDLERLVRMFVRYNDVKNITIPTNGLTSERICAITNKIASENTQSEIHVACSIDGFKATHDKLRGRNGAFDKVLNTLSCLLDLKRRYKNLHVHLATVICAFNIDELQELGDYFFNEYLADGHHFELIRGQPPKNGLKKLDRGKLKGFHDYVTKLSWRYRRRARTDSRLVNYIKAFLHARIERNILRVQRDSFFDAKKWPLRCLAGEKILVLQNDGSLSCCELKPQICNLKNYNFDVKVALETNYQKAVNLNDCSRGCTHGCFLAVSSYNNKRSIIRMILNCR